MIVSSKKKKKNRNWSPVSHDKKSLPFSLIMIVQHHFLGGGLCWGLRHVNLCGSFVSSPREREKRDRIYRRRDEREGQGRMKNRSESEETEEIKTSLPPPPPGPPPPLPLPATRIAGLA